MIRCLRITSMFLCFISTQLVCVRVMLQRDDEGKYIMLHGSHGIENVNTDNRILCFSNPCDRIYIN